MAVRLPPVDLLQLTAVTTLGDRCLCWSIEEARGQTLLDIIHHDPQTKNKKPLRRS